jgi:hypothetical protein
MNDTDRYLFDLQGYVTVPEALSAAELDLLNGIFDEHIAAEVAPAESTHRFGALLDWGPAFLDLIDQATVTPILAAILGPKFRLDHEYADLIRRGKGPIGTRLHGGATPFDPAQYYLVREGQIHSGLVVVAYNLRDVNPGDGGFAAVPGSHKANYQFPAEWVELDVPGGRPFVNAVTGPAGTAIIFTEAMTHGTLPWTGAGERRTIFYKYSPHASSWAAKYYDADRFPDLTERQREILEAPNARYGGRLPKRA